MKTKTLYNAILVFLLTFTLSACGEMDAPGDECVEATDFGDMTTTTVEVDSTSNAWVDTGISISEGNDLQIQVQPGSLLLCGSDENRTINVDSRTESWTPTNINVHEDDQLIISVNDQSSAIYNGSAAGQYNRWGDTSDPSCSSPFDGNCWMYDGMGLNVKVGGDSSYSNCQEGGCSDDGIILPAGNTDVDKNGLYEYTGLPLDTSSLSSASWTLDAGLGLPLYLRVWDSSSDYGDNRGGYVATITRYGCPRYNGENLRAYIGEDDPNSSTGVDDTYDLDPKNSIFTSLSEADVEGNLWLKIYDINKYLPPPNVNPDYDEAPGDGNYGNNDGTYEVKIVLLSQPETVSDAINWLVGGLRTSLEDAREDVFNAILTTQTQRILRAMLALYIIIYGIMFMYGMIEHTQMDFLIRVIKIGIIIQLVSPGSFEFFYENLLGAFTEGSSYLIHVMSNAYSASADATAWSTDQEIEWTFLDQTFSQLFSESTWIKLAGLIFAFPIGWLYFLLIVYIMGLYIVSVAWVILAYLLALVAISLLVAVAPIFIAFILFEKTSELFKQWLNQLLSYALQPVILVALLVIFNFFIVAGLLRVLNFSSCWECLWNIDLGFDLCLWSFYIATEWSADNPITSLPVTIISILILWIFVKMLPKLITYAEKTAKQLSSAASTLSLTGAAKGMGHTVQQKAKATVGRDDKSKARQKAARDNQKLHKRARKELAAEEGKASGGGSGDGKGGSDKT